VRSIIPARLYLLNKVIDFGDMMTAKHIDSIDDNPECIFNQYRDERSLNVHKSSGYPLNPVMDRSMANRWKAA
jgi:hypothetical protein